MEKSRSPRNKTLQLTPADRQRLSPQLLSPQTLKATSIPEGVVCGDALQLVEDFPTAFVDLLILDPPYNLNRKFGSRSYRKMPIEVYSDWLDQVLRAFLPTLKPNATVYICGDWLTSVSIFEVANRHLLVRNRITWERDKGRGAKRNWKNNAEDIWFCTVGSEYKFNPDDIRHRRPVIAPYRNREGQPKDWQESNTGKFRDTHASNLWTDISIPFWSMPENTDHPTQKSEKLIAKLILASSTKGDLVFDPFSGSGSSCVVAKKLRRRYLGIELDRDFALLTLKRLEIAEQRPGIQGYVERVFWPRNSGK